MFSVSLMRYNLIDLIDENDDNKFIGRYREYFKRLGDVKLAEVFERLSQLPPKELVKLRLEYTPRVPRTYASIYVLTRNPEFKTYIVYKNDSYNPPIYSV